jgi:serine/threonine-protein kinase
MPSDRFLSASELARTLEAVLTELDAEASPRAHVRAVLGDAGLLDVAPKSTGEPKKLAAATPASTPLRPAVMGLVVCSLLIAAGGAVLSWANWRESRSHVGGARRLELAPAQPAYLRVVAEPWAHVHIDGQRVETTPFAKPIPLRAGTHYVRLEHPNAPAERRTVELVPGETVLLDVKMKVDEAALAASSTRDAGPDVEADAPPPSP